jgi:hypothetical protein
LHNPLNMLSDLNLPILTCFPSMSCFLFIFATKYININHNFINSVEWVQPLDHPYNFRRYRYFHTKFNNLHLFHLNNAISLPGKQLWSKYRIILNDNSVFALETMESFARMMKSQEGVPTGPWLFVHFWASNSSLHVWRERSFFLWMKGFDLQVLLWSGLSYWSPKIKITIPGCDFILIINEE